jgi:uroporphyrinogen-III decarboxylase
MSEMTPRERLLRTLRGETADRVPLMLEGPMFTSREALSAHPDARLREVAERIYDGSAARCDFLTNCNRYLVTPNQFIRETRREEENGRITIAREIDTPKGKLTAVTGVDDVSDTTWTLKYPVNSLEDIEKIRSVPWELPEGLVAPDLSKLPADFDRRSYVRAGVSSPFVCVAGMMPYQYFLELCFTELPLLKELTEQCCERVLALLDVVLAERSVEYLWMGGCEWLTPPMGSPQLYAELVQEYERRVIERAHAAGALVHVHCHGNVRSTLELVIERGGDFFEPVEPPPDGDITMAEAKKLAAGRITLGGNIEARILANESPETVEAAARAAFEGGKERMILRNTAGPGGPMTPEMLANYHRMIDVWEELSPIAGS